jgi:hypothetical protein
MLLLIIWNFLDHFSTPLSIMSHEVIVVDMCLLQGMCDRKHHAAPWIVELGNMYRCWLLQWNDRFNGNVPGKLDN